MKIIDTVVELHRSMTKEQNEMLLHVADECKKIGATNKQLAPLFACILIDYDGKPSEKEIEYAKKLGEEWNERQGA